MPLVNIQHLTCEIGGNTILQDLTLSIEEQEIHALLGANGSGKSTLAYVLIGCEGFAPSRGTMIFKGIDLGPLPMFERTRLGMTLAWQEPARFEGIFHRNTTGRLSIPPNPLPKSRCSHESFVLFIRKVPDVGGYSIHMTTRLQNNS
jgi:Fe-S cluster assembly ATP-binding protein